MRSNYLFRFDLKYLYGPDYGYRTGINATMTNHVKKITKTLTKKTKIKKKDWVLDIASNDATLLNFYNKNLITFSDDNYQPSPPNTSLSKSVTRAEGSFLILASSFATVIYKPSNAFEVT